MLVPLLGSLFALVGAWMSALAVRNGRSRQAFVRASSRASGTIVGLSEVPDPTSDLKRTVFPRIRFQTPAGREITFESRLGSSTRVWQLGEPVAVRYRAEQPHQAEIDSFLALWGLVLLFALLASVFLGLGLGLLLGLVPA